jgi:hypothetical protein
MILPVWNTPQLLDFSTLGGEWLGRRGAQAES